ncbi:MAG: flagellar biosynthesis regulator FlaF [Rhodobacteraceae bacterium]|nr:flagellar biosynthesis regulator FlaF [Paracoccaceae bacterium]
MNAHLLARSAYSGAAASTRTDRGTEYEVFARITHRLKATASDPQTSPAARVGALHDNRALWTALATDVAVPSNGLPQALRAQIFYLAEFTILHTRKVLAGTANPDALIDINMAVMRGLRQEGERPCPASS